MVPLPFFQILTLAVLSILVTAPIGAVAMSITGPKLLQKSKNTSKVSMENNVNKDVDVELNHLVNPNTTPD